MARRDSAFAVIHRWNRVLLVKAREPRRWQIPGGGIKPSETPWSAALREVKEETGLEATLLALSGIYRRPDGSLVFVFAARVGWQDVPKGGRFEISKRRWMPVKKALRRLSRPACERLLDALRRPSLFRGSGARLERKALRITAG